MLAIGASAATCALAGHTSASAAATLSIGGTLSLTAEPGYSAKVTGTAQVSYACTPNSVTDWCRYMPSVRTVAAGQPCRPPDSLIDGWRSFDSYGTSSPFGVSFYEPDAKAGKTVTACLYAYVGYVNGAADNRLLAQVPLTIPAMPAPVTTPVPTPTPSAPVTVEPSDECKGAMSVRAGGSQVAYGRMIPIVVKVADTSAFYLLKQMRLEMKDAQTGRVFYAKDLDHMALSDAVPGSGEDGKLFYMTLDRGDAPAIATLSWSMYDGSCSDSARTGPIAGVAGSPGRARAVQLTDDDYGSHIGAGVSFGPAKGSACWTTTVAPLRVVIQAGGRKHTAKLSGHCGSWNRRSASVPGAKVTLLDGSLVEPAQLAVTATPAAGNRGKRLTVQVYQGSKRLLRQRFEAFWASSRDRRIYDGTDEYRNYCINESKKRYSSNGRLYCVRPGFTDPFVNRIR